MQYIFNHLIQFNQPDSNQRKYMRSVTGNFTYLYQVWFVAHLANFCHVAQLLLDQSAFKQDKHDKCE